MRRIKIFRLSRQAKLNNKGDTIMEVLIAVAVLSLILVTSFALANRSSQATRQAAERGEANKYVSAETEKLKYYLGTTGITLPEDDKFYCLDSNPSGGYSLRVNNDVNDIDSTFRLAEAACKVGTDSRYTVVFKRTGNTYNIYGRWDSVTGKTVDKINAVHRIYPNIASGLAIIASTTHDLGLTGPSDECSNIPGSTSIPSGMTKDLLSNNCYYPAPEFNVHGRDLFSNCVAVNKDNPPEPGRICYKTLTWEAALYGCVSFTAKHTGSWGVNESTQDIYKTATITYSNANCNDLGSNGPAGFFSQPSPPAYGGYEAYICVNISNDSQIRPRNNSVNLTGNCVKRILPVPSSSSNRDLDVDISGLNIKSVQNIWVIWDNDHYGPNEYDDANLKVMNVRIH